ncbi:MAG: hypothetical protein KAJ14_15125, partial [Candidatus Omnitrophica bacterium]|nr:hypothetical protein [Candidatus Omnitrophota bacterium]
LIKDNILTHESCITITAPTDLSFNTAAIRVRDKDPGFEDKVYGDSAEFRVLGRIVFGSSPSSNEDWFIGETNKTVTWTAYGSQMTSVDILVDYNDTNGFQYLTTQTTSPGSADLWIFDDPSAVVDGVGDHVTENAVIRIQDVDPNRLVYTKYDSSSFNVAGKLENLVIVPVDPGNSEVVVEQGATITWTKTGSAISDIVMEYSLNAGTNWYNISNDVEGDNTTTVPNTESYSWSPAADLISDSCYIKITDPDNSAATTQLASTFIIASKVDVSIPDVNSSWDTNNTETITWQKWGDFATVNIYYRPDDQTAWSILTEAGPVPSCQDELDGLGDTLNGSWDWYIDEDTILSPTAEIKVVDNVNSTATLEGLSDQFTTRGSLEVLWPNDSDYSVYLAGIVKDIKWKRYGNIEGVKVYLDNGTSGYQLITTLGVNGTVDFEGVETEHIETWTPPENIGINYKIKVEDKNNNLITGESPDFKIKGQLQITDPDATSRTWFIDQPQDITWDVLHGNIQNIKIVGSRSGNFIGDGDEFVITNSTPAANVIGYDINNLASGYYGKGSFNWDLVEINPSIIADNSIKYKVLDANITDYDVQSFSSQPHTIKGSIDITTPPMDTWKVGDIDKVIQWFTHGKISKVHIEFRTSDISPWTDVVDPNGVGAESIEGSNSFSVTNWFNEGVVPDVKSLTCQFRITDKDDSSVTVTSNEFSIYPTISNAAITPTPTDPQSRSDVWLADAQNQEVTWVESSDTVTAVDIYYSSTGAGGLPGVLLKGNQDSIDVSGNQSCATIIVPTALTNQAAVRVRDVDADYVDKVYDDIDDFRIVGNIIVTAPVTDNDWKVGEAHTISWTPSGDIGTVNIYYDYGLGYGAAIATVPVTPTTWSWNVPVAHSVSNIVKVKITDADKEADAYAESGIFHLTGELAFSSPLDVDGLVARVDNVGTPLQVDWTTPKGTNLNKVKLEYKVDTGNYIEIDSNIVNDGNYSWTMPINVASPNVYLKITASEPAQVATNKVSGKFAVLGNIYITAPNSAAKWVAGTSNNIISWDFAGTANSVDILYSKDSGTDGYTAFTIASGVAADNVTVGPSGQGQFDWSIPDDFIYDLLSAYGARIKVQDTDYPTTYDESQSFMLKGGLTINDPTGQTLVAGGTQSITWTRTANISKVDVLYSQNNGVSYSNIIVSDLVFDSPSDTQNTIAWDIPET